MKELFEKEAPRKVSFDRSEHDCNIESKYTSMRCGVQLFEKEPPRKVRFAAMGAAACCAQQHDSSCAIWCGSRLCRSLEWDLGHAAAPMGCRNRRMPPSHADALLDGWPL